MEHLKTIMEKLDDMKLSEKVMDDGDYLILMEQLKQAYEKHNVGKFVRVLRVQTSLNVFWCDVDGMSNLNTDRIGWMHASGYDEVNDTPDSEVTHLNRVEVEIQNRQTYYTLKIIEDINADVRGSIDWENNTITKCSYDKMKQNKFVSNPNETIIYINDIE